MVDTSVVSNEHVGWFAGPDSAISEEGWVNGPSLTELRALVNHSAGLKADGTDFALEASDQVDDRSFADRAGAQSRGPLNASGNVEVYTPGAGDTTSVHAKAYETFAAPRTRLALMSRPVAHQSKALAAGDEVSIFRVETDARSHNRNDASRSVGVGLVFQGDALVNYIVPSATRKAPTATATLSLAPGQAKGISVAYETRDVTHGAKYVSSNEAIATVTQGGMVYAVAAGTAKISITVPGASGPAETTVTVATAGGGA